MIIYTPFYEQPGIGVCFAMCEGEDRLPECEFAANSGQLCPMLCELVTRYLFEFKDRKCINSEYMLFFETSF